MNIRFVAEGSPTAPVIALLVARGRVEAASGALGEAHGPLLRGVAEAQAFEGAAGALIETFATTGGVVRRVLMVGTGDGSDRDMERAGGAIVAKLLTSGATEAHVDGTGQAADALLALAFGARLRSWRIDRYRTRLPDAQKPSLTTLTLIASEADALTRRFAAHEAVAAGVDFTRELVSEPANILHPESFVERCEPLRELGVEVEALDEAAMAELGMGALLGVAQGSVRKPRLLVMRWMAGAPGDKPVVLVGKGVTFDTGGISLKPGAGMEAMKWDMGGAGAVAGAMKAIAGRKAKANVIGVCGLVENMPDGNAQRPGDIVTTMSGQTVEVLNTDAEGRLVLGDVVTWVQRTLEPRLIVDLATLTGAMVVSLGSEFAGLFSNDDNLAHQLTAAGEATGDRLWRFPMTDAYDKLIDSPIADIKNIGPREAGSITAAHFIGRFVEEGTAWAHLDIAGTVWAEKDGWTWAKGATGFGVRLLDAFVRDNFEAAA